MRNRRAILFFFVWSVVFALALVHLLVERRSSSNSVRTAFSDLDVRKIEQIEIARNTVAGEDAERILLVRESGKWRLAAPISAEADANAVKQLVSTLMFAEVCDTLSEADMSSLGRGLRDFGLSSPRFTLTLSPSVGAREVFSFGRNTPSGGEVYVREGEQGGIFTVSSRVVEELARPVGDFRRRRLFSFSKVDVSGLGIKNVGEPLSKLSLVDGSWRLVEPVDAPADRSIVDELVAVLCDACVEDYVASGVGAEGGMGADEGYVLSLRNVVGAVEKVVLGAPAGTNLLWALTAEGAVAHVNAGLLARCKSLQHRLEDTRVFPVDAKFVTSISAAEGFPAYVLSRADSTAPWRLMSPVDAPVDEQMAERLLVGVLGLKGIDIVAPDSDRTYTVSVGTATTNFPSCSVSVDALAGGFRLADLHDKNILRYPRASVRRIRVQTAAGAEWDATKAEGVLKRLEDGIRAVRVETIVVMTGDYERYGFGRPSYVLTFELDDATSAMRKLLLGGAAPEGGRYATIGGADAVFVLSPETVSALTKPVETLLKEQE